MKKILTTIFRTPTSSNCQKMETENKKRRTVGFRSGSSLIFVMMIVAGIATVTLGAQRLALVQFGQSVADEDNIAAYYAAKAGIEDGLARFRFSRNTDTVQSGNSYTAERYDVTAGQSLGYIADNTAITSASGYQPTHQYYDLKVAYRAPSLAGVAIAQDDTLELTGFPDSATDYYLRYQFTWASGQTGCFVALQEISQTVSGTQIQPQVVATQVGSQTNYDSSTGTNLLIRTGLGGGGLAAKVRIRPYGGPSCANGAITASFSTVTGSSGTTSAGVSFDSTQTKITATGYFGTTKRTLLATIDRKSGTLLNVYDFNVYGGTGNVTP